MSRAVLIALAGLALGACSYADGDVRPVDKDGTRTAYVLSNDRVRRSGEELAKHLEATAVAEGVKVCGGPVTVIRVMHTNINEMWLTYRCAQ